MKSPRFTALRVSKSWEHRVAATADKVFPLLCPAREYEWIPGWEAEAVYLASGHAEDGGVFVTDFPDRGRGTWVIARYEPPRAIGFVVFYPERYVERLDIELQADDKSGTCVRWTRTYTGLTEEGNRVVREVTGAALDARMQRQLRLLEHYCETGTPHHRAIR